MTSKSTDLSVILLDYHYRDGRLTFRLLRFCTIFKKVSRLAVKSLTKGVEGSEADSLCLPGLQDGQVDR